MEQRLQLWFSRRTWQRPPWSADTLRAAKQGRTVSVVLPALNEQATVGAIVRAIIPFTLGTDPLVDELIVLDSGSTDHTRARAAAAGARVVCRKDVLPDVPVRDGKGEVLWRSLAATSGDLLVFLDSDLVEFDSRFLVALLGPLLTEPGVALVKGFYQRPLCSTLGALRADADPIDDAGGGRVTELLARPLLAALRPDLSAVVQPLGGEYAATRELLESLPFAAGYGVEIGLLLDTYDRHGLDVMAQVNLGVRKHRNRPLQALGVMARQILSTVLLRCDLSSAGTVMGQDNRPPRTEAVTATITQFRQYEGEWLPATQHIEVAERPPMSAARAARSASLRAVPT